MSEKLITKGLFRFVHIVSACFVVGNLITDVFWENREDSYIFTTIGFAAALFVSGVVNIILLSPTKIFSAEDRKI